MAAESDQPSAEVEVERLVAPAIPPAAGADEEAGDPGEFLIRCLAFLLRHGAANYRVTLDPEGWASRDAVARALRRLHPRLRALPIAGVVAALPARSSERFEVRGGQIRARYGHSMGTVTTAGPGTPPETLFHGTWGAAEAAIKDQGLRPMGRVHVHLTSDLDDAERVARAAGTDWVVIRVRAGEASRAGVTFRRASRIVWLADAIAPQFLEPIAVLRGPGPRGFELSR